MKFSVKGLGAIGPGYADWRAFQALLMDGGIQDQEVPVPEPNSISRRERARAPYLVKLAVAVAEQAAEMSGYAPAEMASVFYSCMSDTEITEYMCRVLADNPAEMSPTKFHNSVHNAAAGYWTISNKVNMPATAVSSGSKYSAATALVEAVTQCLGEQIPVLLVVYDIAVPDALKCILNIEQTAAFAMVISPDAQSDDSSARLELSWSEPGSASVGLTEQDISSSGIKNPLSIFWPLFSALAEKTSIDLSLPLGDGVFLKVKGG